MKVKAAVALSTAPFARGGDALLAPLTPQR